MIQNIYMGLNSGHYSYKLLNCHYIILYFFKNQIRCDENIKRTTSRTNAKLTSRAGAPCDFAPDNLLGILTRIEIGNP